MDLQDIRFYGRRVGRNATHHRAYLQKTLPPWELSLEELKKTETLAALFSEKCQEYWLEIGFGSGEHLLTWSRRETRVGLIGVEPFVNGLVHCVREIEQNAPLYEGRLRLIPEDVRLFLPFFPRNSFSKIFILFSDPWPKKRHTKRRLIQADFLETLSTLLTERGQLILAHDHLPYVAEILTLLQAQERLVWKAGIRTLDTHAWPAWPEEWPRTRYGEKALSSGRPLAFFVWEKKGDNTST